MNFLPDRLLSAVFNPDHYPLPKDQWAGCISTLETAFSELPALEQSLLLTYYTEKQSYKSLPDRLGIPERKCRYLLKKSLHQLRLASNPVFAAVVHSFR